MNQRVSSLWSLLSRKLMLTTLTLLLGACEDASAAKDPVWGKQPCKHCAMVVSEPRAAAQMTTPQGDRYYFDDPGCMAAYLEEHSARASWVRDDDGHWIDASAARFQSGARTPMDYGFLPTSAGNASWADVQAAARERERPKSP